MDFILSDFSRLRRYTYEMTASDMELLREYGTARTEDAFTVLVNRHLDLVYSAALRQVHSPELAEEVAQSVFFDLARNALKLRSQTVLSAWLYQVTRRTAIDVIRREGRRRVREQLAVELETMNTPSSDWVQIEPQLDEAMEALEPEDRAAVLLRYFENKSLREVGQALGTSEDAAQKRVSRALERLRERFLKKGTAIGATSIGAVLSANAVQSAPIALSTSISTAVAMSGAALHTTTIIGVGKVLAMTTTQKVLVLAALAAMTATGVYEVRKAARLSEQLQVAQEQLAPVNAQLEHMRQEREALVSRMDTLEQENQGLRRNVQELPKLRGEVSRLTAAAREANRLSGGAGTNDSFESATRAWLTRVSQLKERLAQTPESQIPELQLLTEQDWLNAARGELNSEKDYRRALSALRGSAENQFSSLLQPAISAFIKANKGQFPTELSALQPYFTSSVDSAILQRWEVAPADNVPNVRMGGDWIITQKAAVDPEFDTCVVVGPNGYGSTSFKTAEDTKSMDADLKILEPAYKAYLAANDGKEPTDPTQITPYLTSPEQQAALQRFQQRKAKQSAER